jgi:hypothetical protein
MMLIIGGYIIGILGVADLETILKDPTPAACTSFR